MLIKSLLQGQFMNHPLHPTIVHVPVGLWIGSLVLDIIYLTSGASGAAIAAYYSIMIGLAFVLLALPTGVADFLSIPARTRPKRIAATHFGAMLGVTILYLVNFLWRIGADGAPPQAVSLGQFLLSATSILLLGAAGYLGGILVYHYGVGYRATDKDKSRDSRRAA